MITEKILKEKKIDYMKKDILIFWLTFLFISFTCTNYGKTNKVSIDIEKSDKFSIKEIHRALDCVKNKFEDFKGCNLTKLWYDEDRSNKSIELYLKNGKGLVNGSKAENVIVLFSNFDVGSSGVNQGFNPNSTYSDWNWILIRDNTMGNWRVDDWGY
jgi:hypothetical protein